MLVLICTIESQINTFFFSLKYRARFEAHRWLKKGSRASQITPFSVFFQTPASVSLKSNISSWKITPWGLNIWNLFFKRVDSIESFFWTPIYCLFCVKRVHLSDVCFATVCVFFYYLFFCCRELSTFICWCTLNIKNTLCYKLYF